MTLRVHQVHFLPLRVNDTHWDYSIEPTAKGFTFVLLEDESGLLQLAIQPPLYTKLRPLLRQGCCCWCRGWCSGGRNSKCIGGRNVLVGQMWQLGR